MSTQFISPPASLPPGTRVFAYLRDSGGTDQELSITRQITEITRWSGEHGLIVSQFFADEARSGRSMHKREQLHNLLEMVRRGGIEERGIVVWAYDRFARNAVHSQLYRAEIRSLGFIFHSLTDYIPEGSEAIVFEAFKDYVSEQYSQKLSVNVRSGLRAVVEKYKAVPGTPPRGFMREPVEIGAHRDGRPRIVHRWIPDPELTPTIRLAFEMRARGATLKQITDATQLYPSINSWTTFFSNRLYMGILEYGDMIIDDYCEPIVTPELWNDVQEAGRRRAKITDENNPRRLASRFLFSGLIFCEHCKSPLNGHVIQKKGAKRRDYYICSRKTRRRDCIARQIPRLPLEAEVLNKLEDLALDIERLLIFQARVQDHYRRMTDQTEGERFRLRRELRVQSKRIYHLVTAIAERGHSRSLIDGLHKAEVEEAALRIQVENIEKNLQPPQILPPLQLSALAEEIKDALHGDDLNKKKHAVNMLTSKIVASRSDAHIHGTLYYIPCVCLGGGAPAGIQVEDIHFTISIPKYTKRVEVI